MVEVDKRCGHIATISGQTHTCMLRKGHDGNHYEAFLCWNDLGAAVAIDETAKRERAAAERMGVDAEAQAATTDEASNGKRRKRRAQRGANVVSSAAASIRTEDYPLPEGEEPDEAAPAVRTEYVETTLRQIKAFDYKNPRAAALVEEWRRLFADNRATRETPAYNDLLERVSDLVASIPMVGLIEPLVTKRLEDGSLELVAGWRRMTALLVLYGEDFSLSVGVQNNPKKSRLVALAENIARRDMPWFQIADQIAEEAKESTSKEIADSLGMSVSQVNNYVRVRTNLHPKIWEQVCKWGGPKPITMPPMLKLCVKPPDVQLDWWRREVEGQKSGLDGGGSDVVPSRPAIDPSDLVQQPREATLRPMTSSEQTTFLGALRTAVATHEQANSAHAAGLRFALGCAEAMLGEKTENVDKLAVALRETRALVDKAKRDSKKGGARANATVTKQLTPAQKKREVSRQQKPKAQASKKAAPVAKRGRGGANGKV